MHITHNDVMTGLTGSGYDKTADYLPVNLSAYRYDEANRFKTATFFTDANARTDNDIDNATAPSMDKDYRMWMEYDLNGNITKMNRYGDAGSMDSLSYNYTSNTNKLTHVDDIVSAGTYTVDVDDQSAVNYTYDASGNLITDNAESITAIEWNAMGKVTKIKKTKASGNEDLEFKYNPLGQRIMKIVKPHENNGGWTLSFFAAVHLFANHE